MLVANAVIPKTDLVALVKSITPLRIDVDEQRGRSVTLGRTEADLVPGRGLRLRGDAHVVWDFAHVPIPVTINAWQLVLVPRITSRDRSHTLSFEPVLEELDVKMVPGFVDEKIADAIRDGIAQNRDRLAWDFAQTLSKRFPLPEKVSPPNTFEIFPVGGDVSVSATELRILLRFEARFEKESAVEGAAKEREEARKPLSMAVQAAARVAGH